MAVAGAHGLPLAVRTASASPAEVTLVASVLKANPESLKPKLLIADRAYDSDPLRTQLNDEGIELICPHRRGRVRPKSQDGRKLHRYKRRWRIERLFAWPGNQRRLLVRWERHIENYQAFIQLACALILLRNL